MHINILIMVILIATGFLLKKIGLLSKQDGEVILDKLVFYIFMPAAVLLSMSQIHLSSSLVLLSISAAVIMFLCCGTSLFYAKWKDLENRIRGTFVITVMTLNMAMIGYPLFQLTYGDEGFARVIMLDLAVALVTFTLVYFLAIYYGGNSGAGNNNIKKSFLKAAKLPAIWALLLGIGINIAGISLPTIIKDSLDLAGKPLTPSLLIAAGLYLEPKLYKAKLLFPAIAIKMTVGLAAGFLMIYLFNLDGLNRLVVLVASVAPSGYNTIVYSVKEGLDDEFASTMVITTMAASIILIFILTTFV